MSENIEWPQDPPQAGDQITIGNTTFAWNEDPGIWIGFVNATSSSTATGGGGGLSLGEFAGQTFTGSGTIALDGTGPAWVGISSGSGGGAARVNTGGGTAGNGGAAAATYFFLEDVSVLEGLSYSIGTGGAGGTVVNRNPNQEDEGDAGGASSLTGGGFNIQLTGGGGTPNAITNGAAGTVTATTGITPLTFAEVNDPATEYWNQFVVVNGVNLQLGSGQLSFPVAATGGFGMTTTSPAGVSASATGGSGFGGSLRIVYQNQTGTASTGSSTTINIGGGGGGGGGGISDESFRFATSTAGTGTYTIPFTGSYRIILSGSGGTGWVSDTGGSLSVGGGGGGGMCYVHAASLTEGDVVSYDIGAGVSNSGRDSTGGPGNDSTLTVGDLTLTAGGGGGGGIGVGGTGGVAEGGDFRFDGTVGSVGNPAAAGGFGGAEASTINAGLVESLFANFDIAAGRGGGASTSSPSQSQVGGLLIAGGHNFTN